MEGWGALRGGGPNPEKVGPEGWGPEGWGPKFRAFFALSHRKCLSFFFLWGVSRGILVVFEAPGRSNVHVWSSQAVVCEPRRPGLVGPPGFHTTTREPKRAHLSAPVRERKKERNFGRSRGRAVRRRGVRGEAKNLEHTHHTHKQQPPTSTNKQQQATTRNNSNNQEQQQQPGTTTTTRNNNNNRKFGHKHQKN